MSTRFISHAAFVAVFALSACVTRSVDMTEVEPAPVAVAAIDPAPIPVVAVPALDLPPPPAPLPVVEPIEKIAPKATATYVVHPGDTLGSIAQLIFGRASDWKTLAELNEIGNPTKIRPGEVILFDPQRAKPRFLATYKQRPATVFGVRIHEETGLGAVAERVLGERSAWTRLWTQNQSRVINPSRVPSGTLLWFDASASRHQPPMARVATTPKRDRPILVLSPQHEPALITDDEAFVPGKHTMAH